MADYKSGGLAEMLKSSPVESDDNDEDMGGGGVEIAMADFIKAVKAGDVEAASAAFRAGHLACQEEYGDRGESAEMSGGMKPPMMMRG